MKSFTLTPFDDKSYRSIEEAIKELEALPDPVDEDSDKGQTDIKVETETPPDENTVVDLEGRLIDLNPADNGNIKTQDNWIKYFNDNNRIMVSMPDLYLAGKSGHQQLLDSLRKDFQRVWFISSTRIKYARHKATIIHYFGQDQLIQPIVHTIIVPDFYNNGQGTYLNSVPNVLKSEVYLQALFETKDTLSQIRAVLEKLSNYKADKIKLWTPSRDDRNQKIVRASGFLYRDGVFHVGGCHEFYVSRSRGVRIIAAGATPKNKSGVQ